MNRLGIISALQIEIDALLDNPNFQWRKIEDSLYESDAYPLCLVISGVGKVFATYALSKIIHKVDMVLSLGTSGGLTNEKIGDLYLCTQFIEHDMDASGLGLPKGVTPFSEINIPILSHCSNEIIQKIKETCRKLNIETKSGLSISGDQFLSDSAISQEKQRHFNAALADMESAAIAKICVKEKKDICAIRYISDNSNHNSKITWEENVKHASHLFNRIITALFKN